MIVKNESRIITRLFDTVLPIIDYWIISDTGSTDNTPQIIEEYFNKKNIPGKIYYHQWKNFGHNRDLALKCAQNSEFDFDYMLLLDADMKLVISPAFDKNKLTDGVYSIKQGSSSLSYYNVRLIKKKLNARCVCPTHEYYDIKGDYRHGYLTDLFIDDIGDGGAKSDKYERDIRLLKAGIEEEPNNERYYFYLARSYECIRDNENAIKYYKERIAKGGWQEEVWYSYFSIGNIYNNMNEHEKAVYNYLAAFNVNQFRIENIYRIIEIYRKKGQYFLAKVFIDIADTILKSGKIVESSILFMEPHIYRYMIDYEKSIIAYYLNSKESGLKISNNLVLNSKVFDIDKCKYDLIMRNMKFYLKSFVDYGGTLVKKFDRSNLNIDSQLVPGQADFKSVINPCINIMFGRELYINLRLVNYHMLVDNGILRYKVYKDNELVNTNYENPVETVNLVCSLKDNYDILKSNVLRCKSDLMKYEFSVKGIEDIRIFNFQNSIYFVGNCREVTEDRSPKMVLGKMTKNFEAEKFVVLNGYEDHKCQKNWAPFIYKEKLLLVYSYSPLVILSPDLTTGKCTIFKHKEMPLCYDNFRGGSPGMFINGEWYFIIHEVVFENGRIYYHRIVKLNSDLEIEKTSAPFNFNKIGVEYCTGLAYDKKHNKVLVSWGQDDKEAHLGSIDLEKFKKILE
jgi:glycosyltransferase involved in cell wall biosynthesis